MHPIDKINSCITTKRKITTARKIVEYKSHLIDLYKTCAAMQLGMRIGHPELGFETPKSAYKKF